jgi:hypothetical protein
MGDRSGGETAAGVAAHDVTATSAGDWVRRFAEMLGTAAPGDEEIDALLGLAGIAAHASERTAAPLSTWLAGRAGASPDEAKKMAAQLAAALERTPPPD